MSVMYCFVVWLCMCIGLVDVCMLCYLVFISVVSCVSVIC